MFLGFTTIANLINSREYTQRASVILPLMYLGSFFMSAIAAKGNPQFAIGPQKWVLIMKDRLIVS